MDRNATTHADLSSTMRSLMVDLRFACVKGDDEEIKRLEIELSYLQRQIELEAPRRER